MAKVSKQQSRQHQAALRLLQQDELALDGKIFVYENFHQGADRTRPARARQKLLPGF